MWKNTCRYYEFTVEGLPIASGQVKATEILGEDSHPGQQETQVPGLAIVLASILETDQQSMATPTINHGSLHGYTYICSSIHTHM